MRNIDHQKIIIVGNTTRDAEIKQPEGKTAYADFTVAVSRTKEQKTFFPVRVFGKLAETCEKVKKGAKVLVEGKLDIEVPLEPVTLPALGRAERLGWEVKLLG